MYIYNVPEENYTDPWKLTFEERLNALIKGERKVAYFYESPDNSTFRYRVYNMIQVLQGSQSRISASYFTQNDLDALDKVIDIADVLVICRSRYNDKLSHAITKARNKGKSVFFDIDDLVFNPAYVHLIVNTLDQDLNNPGLWDFWFAYFARLGATMNLCDSMITTNELLAARIQAYAGKPVHIIPNFLNREQMGISTQIFNEKKAHGFERNNQIHLGYFSGTPTHNKDLAIISDALVEILENDPRIIIRIVGFMDIKGSLQRYASRIERYPLQNIRNLQRLIGDVEINLVPLQDNEFTNCKSELKYFEAGIVGTVSMASPTFTYSQSISHEKNGYLARSYEWYEKLDMLVNAIDSLPTIAEEAYRDSEQKYAWYNQLSLIEKTLFP